MPEAERWEERKSVPECAPPSATNACPACNREMVRSSGGKWLCRTCGFLQTCCDP
jgi:ribosomal protein L37AE/L43A